MTQKANITAKRKRIVVLPEVQNYLYQPNRVTNAVYQYTLLQEKVFNAIMFRLQDAVKKSFNAPTAGQLQLFAGYEMSNGMYHLQVPLQEIAKANQYADVIQAAKDIAKITLEIPYTNDKGEKRVRVQGLLARADVPQDGKRSSHINIDLLPEIADLLIKIDKNSRGEAINYTYFMYEIVKGAHCKYTPKVYKFICSWRKKGGVRISLDEFREKLGISDKLLRFSNFKQKVLLPVQEDLFERADCWFNCNTDDFKETVGGKVYLNFKIITPAFLTEQGKRKETLIYILKTHGKFTDKDILKLAPLLNDENANFARIIDRVTNIIGLIHERSGKYKFSTKNSIKHPKAYILKSIFNEFAPDLLPTQIFEEVVPEQSLFQN